MKTYLLFVFLCLSVMANATIRTVHNNGSAQFSTIQTAINAANSGDTILVHGSPTVYSSFTITNKKLTLVGPGWNPLKQLVYWANVQGCTITGAASTGTEIQGFVFVNNGIVISTNKPDSIRFIRNYFAGSSVGININQSSVTYVGYIFQGNGFENTTISASPASSYSSFLFQNNYFYQNTTSFVSYINNFTNCSNVLFDHNLWFGPSSGSIVCFNNNCQGLSITNNIFVRRDAFTNNSNSIFTNNITYLAVNNTPWSGNGNVDAGGNIANQDPQMVDQVSINNGTNNNLLNFTISSGPANNSGTDGKDMGLLYDVTGSLNWNYSRISQYPYIYSMNITNPTIAVNGTLNVQVEARKNN